MKNINLIQKRKTFYVSVICIFTILILIIRVLYIQVFSNGLQQLAYEQQTRDRLIKAVRGDIVDRNGDVLATSETAYSISVINAQIEDIEKVSDELSRILELEYDYVKDKASEKVALTRIKTKVDKDIADEIRELNLEGVIIEKRVTSLIQWNI